MTIISDVVIAKGEEVMVDYTGRAGGELIFDFQGPAHREDDLEMLRAVRMKTETEAADE